MDVLKGDENFSTSEEIQISVRTKQINFTIQLLKASTTKGPSQTEPH